MVFAQNSRSFLSRHAFLLSLLAALSCAPALAAESAVPLPNPTVDQQSAGDTPQVAVLAGGCFWGIQAVFQHTKGVQQAVSGYSGGMKAAPSYEEVSSGRSGHAEVVQVTFNPREISYGQILKIFFSVAHNPTQLNRQGPDVGTQYRSAIFYSSADQKRIAEAYIAQLGAAGAFKAPIVTQVNQLAAFYPAEAYHQDYAIKHPTQPYIFINDLPKVENLKRLLPDLYRATPVTVASISQ
ncbi:MAG: peptide-methionine (S)-S-oxide reductase [Alphaproteobacteria bacterium]|jgi:peptide-methionine (S)-S-oxide reductase|nr:peptide-methionine (S)-S-oxide reductase [Alphaproteobacteria bacterium]